MMHSYTYYGDDKIVQSVQIVRATLEELLQPSLEDVETRQMFNPNWVKSDESLFRTVFIFVVRVEESSLHLVRCVWVGVWVG